MIRYWRHPSVIVKESKIHGLGLHAEAPIEAGTLLVVAAGKILTGVEYAEFVKANPRSSPGLSLEGDQLWLVTDAKAPECNSYLNHSCVPNAVIDGDIFWRAWRDIAVGEEITTDYSTFVDLKYGGLNPCQCGANQCRQFVTYRDWRSPILQARYQQHMSRHILRQIAGWAEVAP